MADDYAEQAAWFEIFDDGEVTVAYAEDEILVHEELLEPGSLIGRHMWHPDDCGGVLVIDTAGEYRYRFVGRHPEHTHAFIFRRIGAP